MTLIEKLAQLENLTPDQRERFAVSKDFAVLEALLSEQGIELTAEEKVQAAEYVKNGIQPLEDDDLVAVSGGNSDDAYINVVTRHFKDENLSEYLGCPVCGTPQVYSTTVKPKSVLVLLTQYYYQWNDCKCKACNKTWTYIREHSSRQVEFSQ